MTTRRQLREVRRRRSRRIRALLAAGVVFGVGAGATLAAWNDSEHATAEFTAGVFGIVGSTDGNDFAEHPEHSPAELSFSAPVTAMSPGTTVYSLFSVRTADASVAGSVVALEADPGNADPGNADDLGQHLRYGVSTISGTTCDQNAYESGAVVVASGSQLTDGATMEHVLSAGGAGQVNYCFAVTLPTTAPNAAQGATSTANWTFLAESS